MRFLTTLLMSLAAATTATASAAPWTDPSNTLSLDAPDGWVVQAHPAEGLTYVTATSAASECHIVGVPRSSTTETTPYRMRVAAQQVLPADTWTQIAGMFPDLFPGQATVQSNTVETEPFWPIQRADYAVAGAPAVHGAIQFRPGLEMWALCRARAGQGEELAAFNTLFHSVGTTNDATLQATAEEQATDAEEASRHSRTNMLGDRERVSSGWGRDQ